MMEDFKATEKVMPDRVIIYTQLLKKNTSEDIEIGNCKLIVFDDHWVISGWYVKKEFQNQGFGNELLKRSFQYSIDQNYNPSKIDYIWDGTNRYVYDWIVENFDAVCDCPIAVRKNAFDDDWNSHIYHLNRDMLFEYFGLKVI